MQCAILLIPLTPALAVFKQKLFYHIQAKGSAMFGSSFCSHNPYFYFTLSSSNGHSSSLIAAFLYASCVHMNELRSALSCWDLLVGIQGCNHFASVVGSVRACTGREGAASSNFRCANVNSTERHHSDLASYLFLTSFLPIHSMHCPTPCTHHASPTVPPARPMRVSRMH